MLFYRVGEFFEHRAVARSRGQILEAMDLRPQTVHLLREGQTHVPVVIAGQSMTPFLDPGDTVFLDLPSRPIERGAVILFSRFSQKYVLHRVVKAGETYSCIGDNQFELEEGLRHDQMIAVVTGFTRGSREYSVDHRGYRLYCRIWHYSRPLRHFWRRGIGWIRRQVHQ
jgi:hypothetical protein